MRAGNDLSVHLLKQSSQTFQTRLRSVCQSDKNLSSTVTPRQQRTKSRFGRPQPQTTSPSMPRSGPGGPAPSVLAPHVGAALDTTPSRCRGGRAMDTGCWLLGGEFEDSVFEERPERRPGPPASYRAKRCEPQVRGRGFWPLFRRPALASAGPGQGAPQTPHSRAAAHGTQVVVLRMPAALPGQHCAPAGLPSRCPPPPPRGRGASAAPPGGPGPLGPELSASNSHGAFGGCSQDSLS